MNKQQNPNSELLTQFQYYIKHQDELVKKYNGKYVVIANKKVIDTYADENEAIIETSKKYLPGTFLVHLVGPGVGNYTTRARC